jgi:uncharacterized protein YyaL (SSP411 family)/aryl-alcohol dehydrogenase-like predicted oxidoreductase
MDPARRTPNRLAGETSPYLLQHAHNPVDWYPWGEEALGRARALDRPILLSIGYAACHWCHVMERESFENEATARLMNEHFVCIKVDREERPDLDEIYMAATVAMSGSGGWPMTVFLAPSLEPFFAGTYFPPRDMHGRPGFPTLLARIAELWRSERTQLEAQGRELASHVRAQAAPAPPTGLGQPAIDAAVAELRSSYDPVWGGFGGAPKFPPCAALELLLAHHHRTGDAESLAMARRTLDAMAAGGMRDHLGGGFHRYATDERWLVPHFEKMLYDNAQLARVYAQAWQVTRDAGYRRVATETLDWALREMRSERGGFFSATDADSEGEEGRFFVWTPAEVEAALGDDETARAFCAFYDVTTRGNWEGKSILHTPAPLDEVARELDLAPAALEERLTRARATLYRTRLARVPPLSDDKILTSWNALMIGALAECGRIFGERTYVEAAADAARFLEGSMARPDGGLYRTTRAGRTHTPAFLEDYAYLADALVDVYEAGGDERLLRRARELATRMVLDFHDEAHGGFFATASDHEALLARMREGQDGATPSPNAVAARALARLGWHFGDAAWLERAARAVRAHGRSIERAPRAFATSLGVVDALLAGPVEVVLVGTRDDVGSEALARALGARFLGARVIVHHAPGAGSSHARAELLAGKTLVDGRAAAYVCRAQTCRAPATDEAGLEAALAADRADAAAGRALDLGRRLTGRATAEGTARYAARKGLANGSATLGATGLCCARIGFGGYRVDDASDEHREALRAALSGGVNLIDTSTNYTDGGSERLVGAVVGDLAAAGVLARDEVIVVSKIGYVQGGSLRRARQRERRGDPVPEMVRYADDYWHCIHPSWLSSELDRSLGRLGLATLDVCLLHNPEYFLSEAARRGRVDEPVRRRFYERIERAFASLESEVASGRIGCYGVSSNTVARDPDDDEATDFARMLEAAVRAGGERHHFRVLELPLNLLEPEGALPPRSLLERVAGAGVGVLANRPLNALGAGGAVVRLAEIERDPRRGPALPVAAAAAATRALEARFAREVAPHVPLRVLEQVGGADEVFAWGAALAEMDGRLASPDQWQALAHGHVVPQVSAVIATLERVLPAAARAAWSRWRGDYLETLEQLLAALRAAAETRAVERVRVLHARLDRALAGRADEGPVTPEPLQRRALFVLGSLPGVTSVLLGMRRPRYVADALAVLERPPLADAGGVLERFAAGAPLVDR